MKAVREPKKKNYAKPHQMLSDILIGKGSNQKEHIFGSVVDAARPALSEFEAQDLSNLAYAIAIADVPVPPFDDGSALFDRIAEKSLPLLGEMDHQRLSNLIWSFGE
eukprot:CAMPEP_0172546356 /NCGR_PEP_ID=MMETSP1067-20121228/16146_1 /TAXON_ID=265564 ORGANISM="Thalassiosira punctigera, Strain Tpunct2005C2" /NCGR_SAMPLE_ID=MMETSP1067 /ASSEMBLY_ACC=CAM_ASM_000444 /LENGTH=106 /DNA_ID=CAMNT_0013333277 /DNA_START=66 /DNA_END=383 /DNA_ORIENTATION=-